MASSPATAVILVDHGSKRAEANEMLGQIASRFRACGGYAIVEPAHMELAEPSIATTFDRCVAAGATRIVIMPYFLLPGRHWKHDIPELAAAAAAKHTGVEYLVTAPIGLHPFMVQVIGSRIEHCLRHARGEAGPCDVCDEDEGCALRRA